MTTPLTFLLTLFLFVFAAALVVAFVKWILGAKRTDLSGFEVVQSTGGMRRGIIRIAEGAAILLVLIVTVVGALLGGTYSYFWSGYFSTVTGGGPFYSDPQNVATVAAVAGAVSGFVAAAFITAPLFTLSAIESNTRRTAAMLERVAQVRANNERGEPKM